MNFINNLIQNNTIENHFETNNDNSFVINSNNSLPVNSYHIYSNSESSSSSDDENSPNSFEQKFSIAIIDITNRISTLYPHKNELFSHTNEFHNQIEIMTKIENIMINIVEAQQNGEHPKIVLRNQRDWDNCIFDEKLTLKPENAAKFKEIRYSVSSSRPKFILIIHLLSKIYKLLQTSSTCTRRELYYQDISIVQNQGAIDNAIKDICCLLNTPPWELGVLATSKGLIAGSVTFTLSDGHCINCYSKFDTIIPQDIMNLQKIESNANFILIVEKDAIYQKLLNEDILNRLGPCILITGKGFPDINTRLILKRLWVTLRIPIFALVDSDPYGIEIMCVYRFGSLAMSYQSNDLAVPAIRWIGIHPTEISSLNLPPLPLTPNDVKKINNIIQRPYLSSCPDLKMQLEYLLEHKMKIEIEAVSTLSFAYLTDVYLPNKICLKELI